MTMTDFFGQPKEQRAAAIFEVVKTGKRYSLAPTVTGHFFKEGITSPYSADMTPNSVKWLAEDTKEGRVVWLKTPGTMYHCWHICTCEKCAPKVAGNVFGERCSGRVWSHSQGDWDSHLRHVDNADIHTFPTMEEPK
jgi:hypothetical protein